MLTGTIKTIDLIIFAFFVLIVILLPKRMEVAIGGKAALIVRNGVKEILRVLHSGNAAAFQAEVPSWILGARSIFTSTERNRYGRRAVPRAELYF